MQDSRDQYTEQMQREIVGKRYEGASLAAISIGTSGSSVIDWIKLGKNFLVYLGAPGVGKTYFCSALIPWIIKKFKSFRYWNERDLLSKIRSGMESSNGDYLSYLKILIDDQFVMIDDIGSSGMNDWRREVLFDAIDQRYESTLPTVFTSNLSRKELSDSLGNRAASRLFAKENLIIEMHDQIDRRQV